MDNYLKDTFARTGHLSRCLEGYAPRQAQIEYALAVDNAITGGKHLMVEGPTGTGKALAYSVPAIYHAVTNNKRVIIATANIALQEQLMEKDLPLLAEALPFPFRYKMLKGKTNYLCNKRAEDATADHDIAKLFRDEEAEQYESLVTWATMTPDGDKSNLPFEPEHKVWREFSTTTDECTGGNCKSFKDCFSFKARDALNDAHVVVVNYSLLFSHFKVKEATQGDVILPACDVLVMDEGHEAAEWARGFLGFRITPYVIDRIGRELGGSIYSDLDSASQVFFAWLHNYYASNAYKTRFKSKIAAEHWRDLYNQLKVCHGELRQLADSAGEACDRSTYRKSAERTKEVAKQLVCAMTERGLDTAYFIDEMKKGHLAVASRPVDVAEWLRTNVFDNLDTVIVTSATLATDGSFDYVAKQIGADHYSELIVDSPFDWKHQAIMVVPTMPDPRTYKDGDAFTDALPKKVEEIVRHAQGRTLALFTSYWNLNLVHEYLKDAVPWRVLRQGELPRMQLLDEFREDVDSVLLATKSFWSGVDVPGVSLSCVLIDKLPFPSPGEPVLDLLKEQDPGAFNNYCVPRAVIDLKQGVGRLIRAVDDVGAVVVLDCRLVEERYGRRFLDSLPSMGRTRKASEIRRFLDHMHQQRAV